MTWSFTLGRLLGSELKVHVTFFLLLGWVAYAAYSWGGWPIVLQNVLFVLLLFGCVLAHEFGHALMARRFGIRTPDITLLPIGGLARLERMPRNPVQEIWVALAGPAVNVAILLVLLTLGASFPSVTSVEIDTAHTGLLDSLAYANLLLAVFNMLPAFPMDGGRVVRALLCLKMDRAKATLLAVRGGQSLAVLIAAWGFYSGNTMLILIAVFVFFAASSEGQGAARNAATRRILARDAMISEFGAFAPSDTLAVAAGAMMHSAQYEFPVLDPKGAVLGIVNRDRLFAALSDETAQSAQVQSIMITNVPQVQPTDRLESVLNLLRSGAPAVAVCNKDGQMIGFVTPQKIGELMVPKGQ